MLQTFFDANQKVFASSDNNVLGSPCCPTNLQKADKKKVTFSLPQVTTTCDY